MFFNIFEILDIILMTLIIGFLFHDIFRKPQKQDVDVVEYYKHHRRVDWQDLLWASMLIAPAIIIHELAHKFTAMSFGLDATFYAACSTANLGGGFLNFYCGLTLLAVILKVIGFGFLFFVPGFVMVGPGGSYLQYSIVALAGPLMHLLFWLGSAYLLKDKKRVRKMSHKKQIYLFFFKQINMFLFILNMLPIPGFDGFNFLYNLIKVLF